MDHLVHRLRRKKQVIGIVRGRQKRARNKTYKEIEREREESERGRVGGREVIQASVNTVLRAWL